ncbi:MAG: alpha/beta fold hydrolase, partial [Pseudoflavonifractor sp.]|nr:alpha/beta fold hydrolase [Pseudoflavonifractor sp.]
MGKQQDFAFLSADGVHTVHAVLWPADGEARAVVQIVHGISEYVERYAPFAAFLNAHGYAVAGHDHLGHGRTAEEKEYGRFPERDGWHTVNRDVRRMRELVGERHPGVPYFLLGHSMGSFQARTYLIDYPGTVDGCILSGTGQEPMALVAFGRRLSGALCRIQGPTHVSRLITALSLGAYNGRFKPNRTSADWISRDTGVVDAYVSDKMCRFVPTVGMFHAMMEGITYIGDLQNARKMDWSTPVALFSGDADPVGGEGKGV